MASTTKAKSPTAKTPAAFQDLAKTLGAKPPKALAELPEADLAHLIEQIETSLLHHQETVEQAEESIINSAPRPLRGTIRKIFGK